VYGVSDRASDDNTGRKPIWSAVARPSGKASGPEYGARFVFLGRIIFCRQYNLTQSDQAQVTLQLKASLYDVV
jgi:hypothetical protein